MTGSPPERQSSAAAPSAWAHGQALDHPIEPVWVYRLDAHEEPDESEGCGRLIGISLAGFIGVCALIGLLAAVDAVALVIPLCAIAVMVAVTRTEPPSIPPRTYEAPELTLDGSPRPVQTHGVEGAPDRLALGLAMRTDGIPSPFDPGDPADLEIAQLIRSCRGRDGLGLVPSSEPDGQATTLVGSVLTVDGSNPRLPRRLADWNRIADSLERRADPETAWLAAIACVEDHSSLRAFRALDGLGARQDQRELLQRVAGHIDAEGHWSARAGLAVSRRDVWAIDRLIIDAPSDQEQGIEWLMERRWQLDPDPAALTRWVVSPLQAHALLRAPLAKAGDARWAALLQHPSASITEVGARGLLEGGGPLATVGARAWLSRPDVQAVVRADRSTGQADTLVAACLDQLATTGAVGDLRLLGIWLAVPRFADRARQAQTMLRSLLDVDDRAGGLAVAAEDGAGGALAVVDDEAAGALSAPDRDR